MIKRVRYWYPAGWYVRNDEKGTESMEEETGQNIQ
jgi:hypothetical protein